MSLPPKPWPTGTLERPERLVARVLAPNASPYTFTGTQTYLVGDAQGLVVIDPGPDDAVHLAALRAAIGDTRVIAIACTHTHRDHSPGAAPLAAHTGAPIIGCAPLTMDDDGPRADAAFDVSYRPDSVMGDGDVIEGTDFALRAIATPGHTSNHLCYALEVGGDAPPVLFTGDHVMGWSTSVVAPPDGDMADYLASLERLYAREDRLYYPAHGPVIDRPRQLVRGMIGHRRSRERQILNLLAETSHAAPLPIADMVARMYRGLDERLWGAAGRSVLAHLIDLERRDMAVRHSDTHWAPAKGGLNE
ncbi:MBL fold metallo-hydrolase [Novosphingobium sp. FSY-8]|uniref:MBL fold metallo-hydrolase n=1 Tax=Novosphingobium ovatum TaxID=1908523 RepID=A0ABW9XGZ9_9SPHN|nr:MBL fold metallo-hydrolase [Novosphingobium ovatum]NBC37829.1 MBL fold metallo-hydrolase [Novosphingobium ovatum]